MTSTTDNTTGTWARAYRRGLIAKINATKRRIRSLKMGSLASGGFTLLMLYPLTNFQSYGLGLFAWLVLQLIASAPVTILVLQVSALLYETQRAKLLLHELATLTMTSTPDSAAGTWTRAYEREHIAEINDTKQTVHTLEYVTVASGWLILILLSLISFDSHGQRSMDNWPLRATVLMAMFVSISTASAIALLSATRRESLAIYELEVHDLKNSTRVESAINP